MAEQTEPTIPCPLCEKEISRLATTCPYCRTHLPAWTSTKPCPHCRKETPTAYNYCLFCKVDSRKIYQKPSFIAIILFVLFCIIVGIAGANDPSTTTPTPTYQEPTQADKLQACINLADSNYSQEWNRTCKERGLQADCKLPATLASVIDQRNTASKNDCYNAFPQK